MHAEALRGFGPAGILAIAIVALTGNIVLPNLLVIPVGALLVLLWAEVSGTPWRDLGYVRPSAWAVALGVAIGVALKLVLKYAVMPLFGAPRVNQAYHFLAGNTAILPTAILGMCVVGFAEETVFRAFFFERLTKLFGGARAATIAIVVVTSILFGLAHYSSAGIFAVEQAIITGAVFGTMFTMRRSIVPVIAAHAAFDIAAVLIIYLRFE
ncbi:MAG TPA: CPBP family intramembrane glutamic endopeptidase [Thermoanaerobaculia bacterium]|nr:CPBP family intramembrane glutamic endopeptidase [Thermoanaerobaculia bacterium]